MIDRQHYEHFKNQNGHYASWAIWADVDLKPKSNIGDLSIFDLDINPNLVDMLNPNIIMVGLNISRRIDLAFGNFHDGRSISQDYKLRYALKATKLWGAYMTDIIKDFEHKISGEVQKYLKANPDFEYTNVELFRQEISQIKAVNPTLIAFGNMAYNILLKHFAKDYHIIKIPHYSMQISKEGYKTEVDGILSNF